MDTCHKMPVFVYVGGSLETAEHFMISVEKQVLCIAHDSRTLVTGLAALMSFYFVLNLKYQPEAEATLEFIQRFFFSYFVDIANFCKISKPYF